MRDHALNVMISYYLMAMVIPNYIFVNNLLIKFVIILCVNDGEDENIRNDNIW